MTKEEHKAFEQLIKLVLTQNTNAKTILAQIRLLKAMHEAYLPTEI